MTKNLKQINIFFQDFFRLYLKFIRDELFYKKDLKKKIQRGNGRKKKHIEKKLKRKIVRDRRSETKAPKCIQNPFDRKISKKKKKTLCMRF